MKSSKLGLGLIILLIVWVGFYFMGAYNTMVEKDETVQTAWSQVENQYQRRTDLIPNLVNTVKGYQDHEAETLEAVVQARANATKTNVNINDPASFAQFQQSQDALSSALSKLMVVVEDYPELKADQSFLELQAQLEGTENRISVERKNYNEDVKDYNVYIRKFPKNLIAGMFGFEKANLFEAVEGSDVAPVVDFTSE